MSNSISFTATLECTNNAKQIIKQKLPHENPQKIEQNITKLNNMFMRSSTGIPGEYVIDLSTESADKLVITRFGIEVMPIEAAQIMTPKELNKEIVSKFRGNLSEAAIALESIPKKSNNARPQYKKPKETLLNSIWKNHYIEKIKQFFHRI